MIRTKLTWDAPKRRWRKMYKGKIYTISCGALGCPPTKAESYQAANQWWVSKKAELDSQKPNCKFSHEVNTLEQRRDWLLKNGYPEQARAYGDLAAEIEQGKHDDLHPSILGQMISGGDRFDSVWQDRLSRDQTSRVPEDRLVGWQLDRYLDLQLARYHADEIGVSEYAQTKQSLTAFKTWLNPETLIDHLDSEKWEAWWLFLLKSGDSIEYKRKKVRNSRNFVSWLAEKGLIQPPLNLHSRRYRFGADHRAVPTVPVQEVKGIVEKAKGQTKLHILLMLNCGMTQQDITDLKPEEIDWTDGTITRRRSKTQHQKQTPIVCYRLWGETWRLLQQYGNRIGNYALLTTTGKAWVRDEIIEGKRHRVDAIRSAYRHLKIPFTLKLFRKTGSTMLDREYPDCVERYLGHVPRSITDRSYVDPSQDRFDKAIAWLGRQFGF
jgi:integrase